MGKKDKQKAEATEVYADARTRLAEHVEMYGGPDDGTTVRFDYTFDDEHARYDNGKKVKRRYYTYAAVWVEDTGMWHLSGSGNISRTYKHADFMVMIASGRVRRAQVATVFDTFKA